jgi:hypothetical protein
MHTNIVVSRYNRNVDFVYRINNGNNINVLIYDKENSNNPHNIPVNKGNEASVYLKYIIDYYDELSEFTFFIHDEEYSWHHSGSIIDKYNDAVLSNKMYYNINDKCVWSQPNACDFYDDLLNWYNIYIEEYIPISKVPNNKDFIYGYQGSAQFLVHKDLIRNLPKEFYIKLYEWIITTNLSNYISGRYLEWTWHIFWYIYPHYIKNHIKVNNMLSIIQNIPNVNTYPLTYVFEYMKLQHKPDTLWLEFGVASGNTINYISKFTNDKVYGFDSFEGSPEKWRDGFDKGAFSRHGILPEVNNNVVLIKGWFNETLVNFIQTHNKKVSFIHMDADLYSSTKYIFNVLKDYIDNDCIIVFDELVNYPTFDGENGELRAFYEFITENKVDYEWIGMNGTPTGMSGYYHENVALIIHSIN